MNKIVIFPVLFAMLFFAASAYAVTPLVTSVHSIDGSVVANGSSVTTKNPFEYKVSLTNGSSDEVCLQLTEVISKTLVLQSSAFDGSAVTPDQISFGPYYKYIFHDICVPANSTKDIVLVFKSNSAEEQKTASIYMQVKEIVSGCVTEYGLFVFNATVPAIPEFPTPLIPLAGILGIAFIYSRNH